MRIIILSASTGGGHMRAANAIKSSVNQKYKNSVVEIVDALEYISPILNKTVTEGYTHLAKRSPSVYRVIYNSSNNKLATQLISNINSLISKKLLSLLNEFNPDLIITTHPFSTEMAGRLKELGKINVPILCIMTDYAPHHTWINQNIDEYVVANDDMIKPMIEMGVRKEKIHPFGIPIENAFYTPRDKNIILKEMGLNPELPTVLIMAGSFGVENILQIYKDILGLEYDLQIIVITGRNQALYDAIEGVVYGDDNNFSEFFLKHRYMRKLKVFRYASKEYLKRRSKFRRDTKTLKKKETRIIYFTNEVDKYMQVADIIITKPGGLTITEALACNLPMAIFDAIPGQEEENANFLVSNNMAVRLDSGKNGAEVIKNLLDNRNKLEFMKYSCMIFDKSDSLDNIINLMVSLIKDKSE